MHCDVDTVTISIIRHDNVIVYGIPESEGEKSMSCKQTVLSIFSEYVTFKTWQCTDVIRAHCLYS